jgi:hypothetical protein
VQFEKTYTREFFKDFKLIALVLRTCAIFIVFEKLTHASFFQSARETILLPIQTYANYTKDKTKTVFPAI